MKKLLKLVFVKIPLWFVALSVITVFALKWIPVNYTPLMAKRALEYRNDKSYSRHQKSVPVDKVSAASIKAVLAAEDAGFFSHKGFEPREIRKEFKRMKNGEMNIRGCSTISQQTAKNVFTLGSQTWFRKAVEAWFTFLIEKIWGKEKILEVYLNVAEFGKGIYGIQAAAEHYFHTDASHLTMADASSLAACLPCPLHRTPESVNINLPKLRAQIAKRANTIKVQLH